MRLMTLSRQKIYLLLPALLLSAAVLAAPPPDAEMAAAQAALASAKRSQPRAGAGQMLEEARQDFLQAQAAMANRKFRDAKAYADRAAAAADGAAALAHLDSARQQVDDKAARNADLRRRLLVLPEDQR